VAVDEYRAVRESGEAVTGTLDAESARQARETLRQHGLYVTRMKASGSAVSAAAQGLRLFSGNRRARVLWLTRQLHLLLLTGMPLRDALASLARSSPRGPAAVVRALRDDITKGDALSAALARHGEWFDGLYVSMVRAGEQSGELPALLGSLARHLQSEEGFRRQMQTALLYPKIVALAAFAVVAFLMSAVVPRFIDVILRRGGRLPLPTAILKRISDFLAADWPWCAAGVVAAWGLWRLVMSRPAAVQAWSALVLRLPVVGPLRRKRAAQRFAVMLAALLKGGMVLTDALGQLAEAADSPLVRREAGLMRERLVAGGKLGEAADEAAIFPASFSDMLSAGQETGALENVLGTVAEAYSEDLEAASKKAAALIEPLAILAVALVVAFVVAAVLLPVFELSTLQ
jgi:type II secretory pathway component PulF